MTRACLKSTSLGTTMFALAKLKRKGHKNAYFLHLKHCFVDAEALPFLRIRFFFFFLGNKNGCPCQVVLVGVF